MTCNNVILAQPEAGTSVNYEIPQTESAKLSFGPEDISGLSLNGTGGLVINFVKGGSLTITNFGELASNDNMLFLSDGTMVDPKLLEAGLSRSLTQAGAADNDIIIGKPADGVVNEITLEPGKDYIFGFTMADPSKSYMQDGKFVMAFDNGGEIVLSNYQEAMAADNAPTLAMDTKVCELTNADLIAALAGETTAIAAVEPAAGEDVAKEEKVAVRKTKIEKNLTDIEPGAGDVAQKLAQVEPAAGEAQGPIGNSGYGFGSNPGNDPLNSPLAIGPLGVTALGYNAPTFEQNSILRVASLVPPAPPVDDVPAVSPARNTLDETNLGPLVGTGKITVDFGSDGPGTITPNGTHNVGGSVKNGVLASCGDPVTIVKTATGYTGTAAGQTVFTLVIDPVTGNYTYTQYKPFDHADATDPNDAITLTFGVVATDGDGDSTNTQINITVLDDGPIANDDTASASEGQTINGNVITPNDVLSKDNNNVVAKVAFNGVEHTVPAVGFVTVVGQYGTLKLYANGDYTYTANSNNPSGTDVFTYTLCDCDQDIDTAQLRITVTSVDDRPILVQPETWTIDETNLGPINLNGDLNANFGQDGPGHFAGTGVFTSTGSKTAGNLSYCGVPVVVTYDDSTGTYTGKAGATTIFTLQVEPDGDYHFSLLQNLDHADGTNPNDIIELNFGVKAVDNDGDATTGVINIKVKDDVPTITTDFTQIDETNLKAGPLVVTDTIRHDFGEDGPGDIKPNGDFVAKFQMDGPNVSLTSGGQPIVVTQTANGYVGKVGATTIFDITVNAATGQYTFHQYDNIDHPDSSNPDDVIWLKFGVTITDWDGDTDTAYIGIDVHDDGPIANDDVNAAGEGQTVTGNVVTSNDVLSTDAPNTVTKLVFNGTTYVVPAVGTVTVPGTYGTLTIGANGAYSYTAKNNNPNGTDVFTYTLKDGDGDTDTANLSISVTPDDNQPIIVNAKNIVDETDMAPTTSVSGNVSVDYGNDGPGTIGVNGQFTSDGSKLAGNLTSAGVPVTISMAAIPGYFIYNGMAGATKVFELKVFESGAYEFKLFKTLDHADPNDPNDIINLHFGITARDADGDVTNGKITICVKDDVPTIGDSHGQVDETNLTDGPLVYSDTVVTSFGQDVGSIAPNGAATATAGGLPLALTSNGVPVVITQTATGWTAAAGGTPVFNIVVNPTTGKYTYTQLEPLDHPNSADHNDLIRLNFPIRVTSVDGDSDTGIITIDVADDGPDAVNDINGAEEGQAITGNVVANDNLSEDVINTVTKIVHNGTTYVVPAGGSVTIPATYGTLIMNSNGTYTYTAKTNDPDGTDVFTYRLQDRDGDIDDATLSIRVTPDGQPVSVSELLAVDETNLTPGPMIFRDHLDADFGIDGAGTITPNGIVTKGGSLLGGNLTSGGQPIVITQTATGYVGKVGATTIFTLDLENDGDYTFQLFEHIDHADATDPNDLIVLNFGVTLTDRDGDTADGTVTIHIHDDAPVAYDDGVRAVNENQSVTGNVTTNDELSEDRPNSVTKVIFNGTEYTVPAVGTVNVPGTYGTLTIGQNGAYTYTAKNNNPNGTDTFTYVLRDYDGDTDTAEFSFRVSPIDDQPVIVNGQNVVDETGGFDTVSGTVSVNYGGDGPGTVTGTNVFTSTYALTSNGVPVSVSYNAGTNTYTGTAGGQSVFTLVVNSNGTYTFQQLKQLDHANASDPNDALNLVFGIKATDADGDVGTGNITIRVFDDAPVANDDGQKNLTENQTVTGNVTTNDTMSKDEPNTVTKVSFNGTDYTVPAVGTVNVPGTYGTLTISATGAYSYTAKDNANGTDAFTYTLKDRDGDTDPAIITFCVAGTDDQPVIVNGQNVVDETGGFDTVSGTVSVNYGGDGPGTVTGTNVFTSTYALKSCGVPVVVTYNATTGIYTGMAGTRTVFTMDINANGTYTFKQLDQLDHANASDPNDALNLVFGIKATDSDGDVGTGNITITVRDDGPVANDDNGGDVNAGATKIGNVLTNDVVGADADGRVIIVNFNGTNVTVPSTSTGTVINGAYGTLTMKGDGTYSYVAKANGNGIDNFTYTLKDCDGDTDPAILSFCVKPIVLDPPVVTVNNGVNDVCVKEDRQVSVPIKASYSGGDGDEVMTLTLKGSTVAGWTVTAPGWTKVGADWVITLPAGQKSYAGNVTFKPPANKDGDLPSLSVVAKVYDPDTATTKTSTDTFRVITDAVADAFTFTTGDFVHVPYTGRNYGTVYQNMRIGGITLNDTDGSEQLTKARISLSSGLLSLTGKEVVYLVKSNGAGGWTRVGTDVGVNAWEINLANMTSAEAKAYLASLAIAFPRVESNEDGRYTGTWQYTVALTTTEKNLSGAECDYTDNTKTVSVSKTFTTNTTPLVIDMDADGVELLSAASGVAFDMNNDGKADKTGWVAKDDALLAIDTNRDGVINNQSELFGNTDTVDDGFANLAQYDSNQDGVIDAKDAAFKDLIVWQDADTDGVSDAGEMITLDQAGITSINLNAQETDYEIEGNWIGRESTFTRADGSTGQIVDAWLSGALDETDNAVQNIVSVMGQEMASGTDAADQFVFHVISGAATTLQGFNGAEGDSLDLSVLLEGQDDVTDAINKFVYATEQGGDTVISVDISGSGDRSNAIDLARLESTTGVDIEQLLKDGNLTV